MNDNNTTDTQSTGTETTNEQADPYESQELGLGDRVRFTEAGTYTVVRFAVDAYNVPELVVATEGLEEVHEVSDTPQGYCFASTDGAVRFMGEMEQLGEIEIIEKGGDPRTVAEYMAKESCVFDSADRLMQAWLEMPTPEEYAEELENKDGVRRAVSTWEDSDVAVLYDPREIEDPGSIVEYWSSMDTTEYDCSEYNLAEFTDVDGISDAPHIKAVTSEEVSE